MNRSRCAEVTAMMEYEENEFLVEDERRYIVLVIYDITDNRRRARMVKCLERYGIRVQKSAFEAFLTEKKYDRMVELTSGLIDPATDSLRIYLLANHTSVRSWGIGDRHVEDVVIF
ncbi:CRISPR-associated endonuclease Cas2 [Centipeda periodontii]|nr:CRISPR-associated endonuclease Cas2 [Centipeda periodontii]